VNLSSKIFDKKSTEKAVPKPQYDRHSFVVRENIFFRTPKHRSLSFLLASTKLGVIQKVEILNTG
jgi:hypothetical protein